MGDLKQIVLAYSRGLDTSVILCRLVTFEADRMYDQGDAGGFVRLNSLRLRIRALARGRASTSRG